jgi:negative regulator of genetic competence, sporulation and motility
LSWGISTRAEQEEEQEQRHDFVTFVLGYQKQEQEQEQEQEERHDFVTFVLGYQH